MFNKKKKIINYIKIQQTYHAGKNINGIVDTHTG